VAVAGDFNGWSGTATPLAEEGNGHWSADVAGAVAGQRYKYVIDDALWRIDPRARQVTSSVGDGIIVDPSFAWQAGDFQAPPWNEVVVYQMHLATFPDLPVDSPDLFAEALSDENIRYLRELGVNTILLLPTGEFPGDHSWATTWPTSSRSRATMGARTP
jgi:1,4-alpha-glucan branching enzyme